MQQTARQEARVHAYASAASYEEAFPYLLAAAKGGSVRAGPVGYLYERGLRGDWRVCTVGTAVANAQLGAGAGGTASARGALGHCDRIEELLIYRSEANALGEDPAVEEEILKLVCTARTKVQKGKNGAAQKAVTLAYCRLHRATASQGKWVVLQHAICGADVVVFRYCLGRAMVRRLL